MNIIVALGRATFGRLPFCCMPGAIVGAITGFVFGLTLIGETSIVIQWSDVLLAGTLLGIVGFLFVLLVFGLWLRYGLGAIFLPALVNALITGILTAIVNNLVRLPGLAALIGIVIGIIVGAVLCQFCRIDTRKDEGNCYRCREDCYKCRED